MPTGPRLVASASRVPSWVGPGAPHPDALDALERGMSAIALTLDDFVIAHAGSLAVALALARGDHPTRDEFRAAALDAWAGANRESAKRGLAVASGPRFELELALPARAGPDRIALFVAFNSPAAGDVARAVGGEASAAGAGPDSACLARLGDDADAIDRWVEAWRRTGLAPASVATAAHPGNRPRVVGLGFEVAGGLLVGPLDLLEWGWEGPG